LLQPLQLPLPERLKLSVPSRQPPQRLPPRRTTRATLRLVARIAASALS
jgi:hypothetical protein